MERGEKVALRPKHELQPEVAKLPLFNKDLGKMAEFVIAYKLYIRTRIRKEMVEEQVQWILTYVQGVLADI